MLEPFFSRLRFAGKTRKPRFPRHKIVSKGQFQNTNCITSRTAGIDNRSKVANVERDKVMGKSQTS